MFTIRLIQFVICLCQIFQQLQAAKILAVFGIPHPAENEFAAALLNALHERGHEITVIIRFSSKMKLHRNIKKINIDANNYLFAEFVAVSGNIDETLLVNAQKFYDKNALLTLKTMQNPSVKELMKHERFDLIILETFMSQAFYGLGEYFKAPMIGITNLAANSPLDDLVGNFSPLSTVPSILLQHTFESKFVQRFLNVALLAFDKHACNHFVLRQQHKLYKRFFPNATLTFDQAKSNFSLVLLNQHFSLSFPRPYVPNMIEVAGLHIKENQESLPFVQQFLNDSTLPVVYINLSIDMQTLNAHPISFMLLKLLQALQSLNLRVIWHMDYLPPEGSNYSNLLHLSNVARSSVLKQPQVKLFITTGDIQCIIEAVYYARPILGLPLFGDQHMNMNLAAKAGYGLSIKFITLNSLKIKNAVLELLNNLKYHQTVEHVSKIFRDQPMQPKDKAIYWIEYVVRHQGAVHMMSRGRFLNFWQFHNIDVFILYFAILIFIIFINWLILQFLYYLIRKFKYNFKIKIE